MVDPALLVQESVTAIVQVQGKLRAKLQVSPDISEVDLEAVAMADPHVQRALDGRPCASDRARAEGGQHRRRADGPTRRTNTRVPWCSIASPGMQAGGGDSSPGKHVGRTPEGYAGGYAGRAGVARR